MSESSFVPFLLWGKYKSKDENNPDVLHLNVIDSEPTDTQYSTNIESVVDDLGIHHIPLHNFASPNKALLVEWTKLWKARKIKDGSSVMLHTWMGVSKRNKEKPIRRWRIFPSTS